MVGSTAYTSLLELGSGQYVVLYDRLANGWHFPPGPWGDRDRTFSLRFSAKTDDARPPPLPLPLPLPLPPPPSKPGFPKLVGDGGTSSVQRDEERSQGSSLATALPTHAGAPLQTGDGHRGAAAKWSAASVAAAKALVRRMTLAEKVAMLHGSGTKSVPGGVGFVGGNERLGIPPLIMANGPQGWGPWTGEAGNSTCWPSGLTVAATFDVELARRWGEAMGTEFFEKGTNVQASTDPTEHLQQSLFWCRSSDRPRPCAAQARPVCEPRPDDGPGV
jgi:hypothetical protein